MLNDNSISFDGSFIKQAGAVILSWEEFVKIFIDQPKMARRDKIFKEYNRYLEDLTEIIGNLSFTQWVDGSFTTKKTNPNDIDFVTFLPEDVYFRFESKLTLLTKPKVQVLYKGLIDAYIMPDSEVNRNAWLFEFTRVKGRNKKSIPGKRKGFIELNIQKKDSKNEE
jgi:hypothetical protein